MGYFFGLSLVCFSQIRYFLMVSSLTQLLLESGKTDHHQSSPTVDMCKCSNCATKMKVSECEQDYGHHDGWEMPAYTEILCPHCDDGGCVDDFWPSDESIIQHIMVNDTQKQ